MEEIIKHNYKEVRYFGEAEKGASGMWSLYKGSVLNNFIRYVWAAGGLLTEPDKIQVGCALLFGNSEN